MKNRKFLCYDSSLLVSMSVSVSVSVGESVTQHARTRIRVRKSVILPIDSDIVLRRIVVPPFSANLFVRFPTSRSAH